MELKYNYVVLKSPDAGHRDRENDDSARLLQTQFLNEAVNFVQDSVDASITVTRNPPDSEQGTGEQRIILSYEDVQDLPQKEILEIIERKFVAEYERVGE